MHTVFAACRAPGSNLANLFRGGPTGCRSALAQKTLLLIKIAAAAAPRRKRTRKKKWVQQKLQQPLLLRRRRHPLLVFFLLFSSPAAYVRVCGCALKIFFLAFLPVPGSALSDFPVPAPISFQSGRARLLCDKRTVIFRETLAGWTLLFAPQHSLS